MWEQFRIIIIIITSSSSSSSSSRSSSSSSSSSSSNSSSSSVIIWYLYISNLHSSSKALYILYKHNSNIQYIMYWHQRLALNFKNLQIQCTFIRAFKTNMENMLFLNIYKYFLAQSKLDRNEYISWDTNKKQTSTYLRTQYSRFKPKSTVVVT